MPLKGDGPRITALGEMIDENPHPTIASDPCQALGSGRNRRGTGEEPSVLSS